MAGQGTLQNKNNGVQKNLKKILKNHLQSIWYSFIKLRGLLTINALVGIFQEVCRDKEFKEL